MLDASPGHTLIECTHFRCIRTLAVLTTIIWCAHTVTLPTCQLMYALERNMKLKSIGHEIEIDTLER